MSDGSIKDQITAIVLADIRTQGPIFRALARRLESEWLRCGKRLQDMQRPRRGLTMSANKGEAA